MKDPMYRDVQVHYGSTPEAVVAQTQLEHASEQDRLEEGVQAIRNGIAIQSELVAHEMPEITDSDYRRNFLWLRLGDDGCQVEEVGEGEEKKIEVVRYVEASRRNKKRIVLNASQDFHRIMSFALPQANLSAA